MKAVRVLLIIALVISFGIRLISGPITESQASKVAMNFFFERVQSYRATTYSQLNISEVIPVTVDERVLYYMINFEDGGFVCIAGINEVYPVLCYSFEGRYGAADQPANFAAWMKQYQGEILKVMEQQLPPNQEASAAWDKYLAASPADLTRFSGREVLPLLTSNWDQDKYYNEMCPADAAGPGGHCYAGCVATAMGQLMNYFRWPQSGAGSYTYYCPPYDTLTPISAIRNTAGT